MSGESNNIKYNVEPQFIDMGLQLFDKSIERDLLITNNGKVSARRMIWDDGDKCW